MMDNKLQKQLIRQRIITKRNALSLEFKTSAALAICNTVRNLACFTKAEHIAYYWPHQSEVSPLPLLTTALTLEKNCYLPCLDPLAANKLIFRSYTPTTIVLPNKYGILEPAADFNEPIELAQLSLIFLPLLAFDAHGIRLGMGGGYYDATLRELSSTARPKYIGLSYALQEVSRLPMDIWDLKLDAVVTENGYKTFNNS